LDSPLSDDQELSDYKDLLNHVSDNIEDYNEETTDKKDGKFTNDQDYVEMKESSTQFISDCSSSSDNDSSFLKDAAK
jgi:hypothetical protein